MMADGEDNASILGQTGVEGTEEGIIQVFCFSLSDCVTNYHLSIHYSCVQVIPFQNITRLFEILYSVHYCKAFLHV